MVFYLSYPLVLKQSVFVQITIYSYICVFGQHFFINTYFIEQYRHVLSTYFCICPFQLLNWFYCVQQELVDETPITNCYPSNIIRGVFLAKAMWPLHVHYYFVFILVCCCSVLFISIISSSSKIHLSTLVLHLKLILLSLGCFILIWSALRICDFCFLFSCSNIVVCLVIIFQNSVFRQEYFFKCCAIELVSDRCIVSHFDRV